MIFYPSLKSEPFPIYAKNACVVHNIYHVESFMNQQMSSFHLSRDFLIRGLNASLMRTSLRQTTQVTLTSKVTQLSE